MQTLFIVLVGMLVAGAGTALGIMARDEIEARGARRSHCSAEE
jgi:hypothetical protein